MCKPAIEEKKIREYKDPKITRLYQVAGGFLYFRYINNSDGSTLNETVRLTKHENLVVCPPENNSDEFKVKVGPKSVKIVKYSIDSKGGGGYSFSMGYSSSISLGAG